MTPCVPSDVPTEPSLPLRCPHRQRPAPQQGSLVILAVAPFAQPSHACPVSKGLAMPGSPWAPRSGACVPSTSSGPSGGAGRSQSESGPTDPAGLTLPMPPGPACFFEERGHCCSFLLCLCLLWEWGQSMARCLCPPVLCPRPGNQTPASGQGGRGWMNSHCDVLGG